MLPDAHQSFTERVADNVMAAIIADGTSIREAARLSGISATRLHGRLHGDYPFNTDELDAMAKALGVEPWDFVPRD